MYSHLLKCIIVFLKRHADLLPFNLNMFSFPQVDRLLTSNICDVTHLVWRSAGGCEHAHSCQTGSVHGWSPGRGAARVGWWTGRRNPGDSKTPPGHYHDAQQKRNTWKRAANSAFEEKPVSSGRKEDLCALCGPYPERDWMSTKSLCLFKGVKRMHVDRENDRRPAMMVSLSLWAELKEIVIELWGMAVDKVSLSLQASDLRCMCLDWEILGL